MIESYLDGFENLLNTFSTHGIHIADLLFTPIDPKSEEPKIDESCSEFSEYSNGGTFQILALDTLEFIEKNID